MSHENLINVIKDNTNDSKLITFINNCSILDLPYIITETLYMLSDNSLTASMITDRNKLALATMIKQHFDLTYDLYMEEHKVEDAVNYGKIEIYKIDSVNGVRYATKGEVDNGVIGLIGEYMYPAGQEEFELLSLLYWTFTGIPRHFRNAGFDLTYNSNGQVQETVYQMISMSADKINKMFEFVGDKDRYGKAIRMIDKLRKKGGFKYASYADDEVTEDISIKQIIHNIDKTFPRSSPNPDYRKALAFVIRSKEMKLSPLEISFLREVYYKFALDRTGGIRDDSNVNIELRDKCNEILDGRKKRLIQPKHFAFKIIDTLSMNGYVRCSKKQYEILNDALKIIQEEKERMEEVVEATNNKDTEYESLSDILGDGLL